MSPSDTAVTYPTTHPRHWKSQVWPFALTQIVSVSVAIVEMHRAKSNLIFFERKIKFYTL